MQTGLQRCSFVPHTPRSVRTLLIDNYDSYTFNLFHLLGEVNGEEPVVVRNDEHAWDELARWDVDNVVISPGPGRPERARDLGVSLAALRQTRLPVLGVCLGHQALALIAGGSVRPARAPAHGRLSAIVHDGEGLFAGLPQGFTAVRYHSLTVGPVPARLRVTAWTDDGVVMGLEDRAGARWGVQFHPESICTEHGRTLIENFRDLTLAGESRSSPRAWRPKAAAAPARAHPRRVRVLHRRLADVGAVDAEAAFATLFGDHAHAVWLDSARIEPGAARFSYLGAPDGPLGQVVRYDSAAGWLTIDRDGERECRRESVLDYCRRELARLACAAPELPLDFVGGFAGYLAYELKDECGGARAHASTVPDAALALCDRVVALDHVDDATYLVALAPDDDDGRASAWLDETEARLRAMAPVAAPPAPPPAAFTLRDDRDAYLAKIDACLSEIVDGESYEICLTTELCSDATPDPLDAYRALRARNPAPHAALLRLGDLSVLSSSPERFLAVGRDRVVESRPIKGTAPRAHDPVADGALRAGLAADDKVRAENLMIVDLVRNDLGRVCAPGTVEVPALMVVESYATVHQLVSVVRGRLRDGLDALDAVRASFPGGSMTGAPKLRTMEIIDALEGRPRGVYSGALGFLGVNGTADLSIVIRTLVVTPDGCSIGAGGAIVAGSDPPAEFDEMALKAQPVLEAVGGTLAAAPSTAVAR